MKLLGLKKVKDGTYLKNYELTYRNKSGMEKVYEIVSRRELDSVQDLGKAVSGVSIVAFRNGKMLLLREFRMGVNKNIYNLCAGMNEEGESVEQCIERELYEETGLKVKRILRILRPSFAAVAISDMRTRIAFVEVEGTIGDHTSPNEEISPAFYSKEEISRLLETEEFSARAQMAAFSFCNGGLDNMESFS